VPHSSRVAAATDEWAAQSCRPLGLDFNRSSNAGRVVVEAAPLVVARRSNQSARAIAFEGGYVSISLAGYTEG
jgi:hypothetical protein